MGGWRWELNGRVGKFNLYFGKTSNTPLPGNMISREKESRWCIRCRCKWAGENHNKHKNLFFKHPLAPLTKFLLTTYVRKSIRSILCTWLEINNFNWFSYLIHSNDFRLQCLLLMFEKWEHLKAKLTVLRVSSYRLKWLDTLMFLIERNWRIKCKLINDDASLNCYFSSIIKRNSWIVSTLSFIFLWN